MIMRLIALIQLCTLAIAIEDTCFVAS